MKVSSSKNELVYRAPPAEETVRRVYALPISLVKRVHEFGFAGGHQSEVSAVKELLELGLTKETSLPFANKD